MIRPDKIRTLGRVVFDGTMLWMMHSASEVSFVLRGATELRLKLRADDTVTTPDCEHLRPRYAVYLNGRQVKDARMEREEEILSVTVEADGSEQTVRLVKLSECTSSLLALAGMETDGDISPTEPRDLRIEFIGDSITCGYGVEGRPENGFSTATENAEKGFAVLTARALDADSQLTCFSGHGIVSGYTDDPAVRNTGDLVPPYYGKAGRNGFRLPDGRLAEEIPWDFESWQPQVIVINLGTNDLSWCRGFPEREEMYRTEYVRFLGTVRKYNPEARILCVLGLMGTGLNEKMTQAVADYCRETGDTAVRAMTVEEQDMERDGAGADWHPSEITQKLFAEKVTDAIRKWRAE